MKVSTIVKLISAVVLLCGTPWTHAEIGTLSLTQAIELARQQDPWLQGSHYRQRSFEAESVAAAALPDPQLAIGFANLPIDSFDFNQEPMTQFKVGVSQTFARGSSRSLNRQRYELMGDEEPLLRDDRQASITVQVSHLWLDAYLARESVRLIEADRELFEYLVDVAQSSYSSGVGNSRQQDIIRAQLELTRLDDRLTALKQHEESAASRLSAWLGAAYRESRDGWQTAAAMPSFALAADLSEVQLKFADQLLGDKNLDSGWLAEQLLQHPAIRSKDKQIDVEETDVLLAKQNYKPQWGVNASYGYRDDASDNVRRDDFFSVGVTFDLPIFTGNRQDRKLQASIARAEEKKTEKWYALRNFQAALENQRVTLKRLIQRQRLYQGQLLEQMHDQAEASLTAYTTDDGDFSEVVRARIAELNAKIEALEIEIDRQKTVVELNYFFAGSSTGSSTGSSAGSSAGSPASALRDAAANIEGSEQ